MVWVQDVVVKLVQTTLLGWGSAVPVVGNDEGCGPVLVVERREVDIVGAGATGAFDGL